VRRAVDNSKVEAGFVGGLGLECPLLSVSAGGPDPRKPPRDPPAQGQKRTEPGLIVLLGSAQHGVTGESMRWFARMALECGLPTGVRVVAVGGDTDKLLPAAKSVPGLELRGWLEQPQLDALLTRAAAAVVPQRLGFGALTRLPELACAGVPVITFNHPSYAPQSTRWAAHRSLQQMDRRMRGAMRDTVGPAVAFDDAGVRALGSRAASLQ